MFIRYISGILAALSLLVGAAVSAQDKPMRLESGVQLLRVAEGEGAQPQLVEAKNVVPGDTLVFTTKFHNQGAGAINDFVIVNPLPADVVLTGEPAADAEVSVDGGKAWGRLSQLTVADDNGEKRPATISDITHLRWEFGEIPSGEAGQVQFSATVR